MRWWLAVLLGIVLTGLAVRAVPLNQLHRAPSSSSKAKGPVDAPASPRKKPEAPTPPPITQPRVDFTAKLEALDNLHSYLSEVSAQAQEHHEMLLAVHSKLSQTSLNKGEGSSLPSLSFLRSSAQPTEAPKLKMRSIDEMIRPRSELKRDQQVEVDKPKARSKRSEPVEMPHHLQKRSVDHPQFTVVANRMNAPSPLQMKLRAPMVGAFRGH